MMQKLTRREMIKLAATAGLAMLLGALASGIDPEEMVEQLEQPTEEPKKALKRWFLVDGKTRTRTEITYLMSDLADEYEVVP